MGMARRDKGVKGGINGERGKGVEQAKREKGEVVE